MTHHQHRIISTSVVLALLMASPGWSQSVPQRAGGGQIHPQTVNATTILLLKMKHDQLQLPTWLDKTKTLIVAKTGLEWLKRVSGKDPSYVSVDIPYSQSRPVLRVMVPNRTPAKLDSVKGQLTKYFAGAPMVDGDFVVASPTHSLADARYAIDEKIMPAARPRFEQAAKAVSEFPVQILFVPPRYVSDTFDELLPELPDQLGGGPTTVLTKGIRWAALGVDLKQSTFSARIQSDSPQAAEAMANRLPALLKDLLALIPEENRTTVGPAWDALLGSMKTTVMEDQLHVSFGGLDVGQSSAGILASVLETLTGRSTRGAKRNRLRSIVLGILNYESATGSMPPDKKNRDANGKSKLSWRVHILPYLEEAELYSRFHLDESWDSPHNIELLDQMPRTFSGYSNDFLSGLEEKPGYTSFLAPVGEGTVFGGDEVTKFGDIKDGTSLTLVVVEVKPELAVPWTAPQDYRFDVEDPGAGLAWGVDDATGAMSCDGAWHLLPKTISDETLRRLFQMNDGKPVGYE